MFLEIPRHGSCHDVSTAVIFQRAAVALIASIDTLPARGASWFIAGIGSHLNESASTGVQVGQGLLVSARFSSFGKSRKAEGKPRFRRRGLLWGDYIQERALLFHDADTGGSPHYTILQS